MSSNTILKKAGLGLQRSGDNKQVLAVGPANFHDPRGVIETVLGLVTAQTYEGTKKGPYGVKFPSPFHNIGSKNLGMLGKSLSEAVAISRDIDISVNAFQEEYEEGTAATWGAIEHPEEHYRIRAAPGSELPDIMPDGFVDNGDKTMILGDLIPFDELVEKIEEVKEEDPKIERWVQLVSPPPAQSTTDSCRFKRAVAHYALDQNKPENRGLVCAEFYKKMSNNYIGKILKTIFPIGKDSISVQDLMEAFEKEMDGKGFGDTALVQKASEGILLKWKGCLTLSDKLVDGVAVPMVSRKN